MAKITMLDLAKRHGSDPVVGLIEENVDAAPEYARVPVRPINGTTFKRTTRKSLPASQFRHVNEGTTPVKSEYSQELAECFFIDDQIEVDTATLEAEEDGNVGSILADEASGVMLSALQLIGAQFYYGTDNDAKGFQGLTSFVHEDMLVGAGGTTSSTGSSVFAVKFGVKAVHFVAGKKSSFKLDKWRKQQISDPSDATKKLTALVNNLQGWIGLDVGHIKSVGQIYNLTEDTGKGFTDALVSKQLAKFPVGWRPDVLFATKRSVSQLQQSRSAIAQVSYSQGAIAPWPTESNGIPIVETDSISDTEEIV
jgi:hypothetical protein